MSKKGKFGVKIKFENEKIVDHEFNRIEDVDQIFKNLKRKFK